MKINKTYLILILTLYLICDFLFLSLKHGAPVKIGEEVFMFLEVSSGSFFIMAFLFIIQFIGVLKSVFFKKTIALLSVAGILTNIYILFFLTQNALYDWQMDIMKPLIIKHVTFFCAVGLYCYFSRKKVQNLDHSI